MKRRYYFFPLSILLSVVFYWSCQTDLVAPQTEHVDSAITQNLTARNDGNNASTTSLAHEENDNPIIGKIVARRDRPETWDDLGDNAHFEYYARTFAENEDVQAIFFVQEYPAFGGIRSQINDDLNFVLVEDGDNNSGLGMKVIGQPEPIIIYCVECLRNKKIIKKP